MDPCPTVDTSALRGMMSSAIYAFHTHACSFGWPVPTLIQYGLWLPGLLDPQSAHYGLQSDAGSPDSQIPYGPVCSSQDPGLTYYCTIGSSVGVSRCGAATITPSCVVVSIPPKTHCMSTSIPMLCFRLT